MKAADVIAKNLPTFVECWGRNRFPTHGELDDAAARIVSALHVAGYVIVSDKTDPAGYRMQHVDAVGVLFTEACVKMVDAKIANDEPAAQRWDIVAKTIKETWPELVSQALSDTDRPRR